MGSTVLVASGKRSGKRTQVEQKAAGSPTLYMSRNNDATTVNFVLFRGIFGVSAP